MVTAAPLADGDNPEAYLPGDRRRALIEGRSMPDRVTGAAIFADISGFTPLTEALAIEFGARRGAEQLSATLETVFGAVLAEVHRHAGSAIYFSGDALTCWIDQDDGVLALACGFAMQRAVAANGVVRLPSGAEVQLAMKVAVAVGPARRFVVGDHRVQLIDVLAGRLIDELADAESAAGKGEVIITESATHRIADRATFGEDRVTSSGARVRVVERLDVDVALPPEIDAARELPIELARRWLLPAVWERMLGGQGDFLSELRVTVPLFLRFGGIEYDADEDAIDKLDAFVLAAQHIVDGYGGNVLQLTLGDKGAYLYAVFGAPLAHEDDCARACAAALELVALDGSTAARDISIGISRGVTRSGTYGHRLRRTFCCLGDPVNLAARLMSKAPCGGVYVADNVRILTGDAFAWSELAPMRVKGKAEPVHAHALRSRSERPGRTHTRVGDQPMIGRQDLLAELRGTLSRAEAGHGRVVGITADAGLGKTRLVAELLAGTTRARVATGEAQAFGVRTAYYAWRDILLTLFDVAPDCGATEQLAALGARLADLDPELAARAPLLGTITGVELQDNELTAALDAKVRKGSLELLVVQFLARSARRDGPIVLVVEDCHGLDPLAQDLLERVMRSVVDLPILLIATYRPISRAEAPAWLGTLRGLAHATETELSELEGEAADVLLTAAVATRFGISVLPERCRTILHERTQGNPFHVEQLMAYLHASGLDPADARALQAADLPDTLQSLVLSRIDALIEGPRRTVRVASVIGRSFDVPALDSVYPELGGREVVMPALRVLGDRDLVLPEDAGAGEAYLFRHSVVREVAYESLPFALRAVMHERTGQYLEAGLADAAATRTQLDLLAHHFARSDNTARKRHYLLMAGNASRDGYANETAIEHYENVLPLLSDAEAGDVLNRLGQVHELVGDWARAESSYRRAGELATALGDPTAYAWTRASLAEIARKRSEFPHAAQLLADAAERFADLHDEAGVGRVLHLQGTLAGQQQQLDTARNCYERSLEIRRRLGDKSAESSLLANLGVIAEYAGDYPAAIDLTEQALALREQLGDRWAVGHAHSNLGQLLLYVDEVERAIASLSEALRLHREVGDLWMTAIDYDNLASAELRNGNLVAAAAGFASCVEVHRLVDEPWSTAHLLEDVAGLALESNTPESAFELVGAADALRSAIGSPRTASQQADQERALAVHLARIGEPGAAELLARGRRLSAPEALDVATAVCRSL